MEKTHLLPRHGVLNQHKVCQAGQVAKGVQIRQLAHVIRCQDQRTQVRNGGRYRRLDLLDSVTREEEGAETRKEGEVSEGGDIVICEVDGILVLVCLLGHAANGVSVEVRTHLGDTQVLDGGYFVP